MTIKLHPRCRDTEAYRTAAAEFPHLPSRIVRRGSIARLVRRAACVINCTSSAGIEAAALGASVIELVPAGSLDLLPAHEWNTLGTAATEPELRRLLHVALNDVGTERTGGLDNPKSVFAAVGDEAARRVVNELVMISSVRIESTIPSSSSSSSSSKMSVLPSRTRTTNEQHHTATNRAS